jgi:hypothetical protein
MAAESKLEQWAREQAQKRGCKLVKWVSPGNAGVPDRIFIGRMGFIVFLEFKAPKGTVSLLQQWWLGFLTKMGFKATTIDTKEQFLAILIEEEANYSGYP